MRRRRARPMSGVLSTVDIERQSPPARPGAQPGRFGDRQRWPGADSLWLMPPPALLRSARIECGTTIPRLRQVGASDWQAAQRLARL
jgi:hypothetical protein